MTNNDVETVQQALAKLLAIADRIDTRNQQASQRIDTAAGAMEQGVARLDHGAAQFARDALQRIGADIRQAIAEGAGQAVDALEQQLQQTAHSAQRAAQAIDEQRKGLTAARHALVWNAAIALLVGSLLAAGGTVWVAHRTMQELAQAHFAEDVLHATQSGAITECGGALCARVGKNPQRYGGDNAYALLAR